MKIIKETFKILAKRKNKQVFMVSLGFLFLFFLLPQKAKAGLDNSSVISDSRFTASGTMSEQDIQWFLTSKGSYLANYTVPAERDVAWHGVNYHESPWIGPVGSEVNSTGWSAAHLIYQVSQWYGINPQVLLATIQKESSLITNSNPPYYGLVQWSMGYAYTEGGILNVCRTATNHNPTGSCAGFAMQMDWAGGGLKSWMTWANNKDSRAGQYYTGNTVAIDGQSVYLGNGATAALYRYTPHIQTSFYNLFNLWFSIDRVIASNGDPRQWIVDYATGTRQYIPSDDIINAWNLNSTTPIKVMDARILGCYRDTAKPLGKIVRPSGFLAIYYVEGGKKFPIASAEALAAWGFSSGDVADTTAGTGGLVRTTNTVTFLGDDLKQWLIDFTVNTKYYIPSPAIGSAWDISTDAGNQNDNAPTISLSNPIFSGLSQGPDLNRLARPTGGVTVYFNDGGKRYNVLSPEMMAAWGFSAGSILNLSHYIVEIPTHRENLGYTVKDPVNTNIYMADGTNESGKTILRQYGSPDVLVAWEGNVANTDISQTFFSDSMTVSADEIATTKITHGGTEKQALSGQKLPMTDNTAALYPGIAESISDATFNRLVPSASVSQFIRSNDSLDVYMIDGTKKHKVRAPNILRAWGIGAYPAVNIVNNGYSNLITSDSDLNTFEADVGGQLYIMDGRKITVPSALDGAYRTSNIYSPSAQLMSLLPAGENASNFLKGFNSVPVYLMDAGNLRHIRTPEDLSLLSGSETITSISDYALGQFSESAFVGHYVTNGSTKYIINAGNKYTVSDTIAGEWGLSSPDSLSAATISRFSGTSTLTNLVRDSAGKIYLVNQGKKRHILGPSIFQAWGLSEEQVNNVSDVLLNTIPTGQYLDILVKTPDSPSIYKMEGGTKRHILSPETFLALGYNSSMVSTISATLLNTYTEGTSI